MSDALIETVKIKKSYNRGNIRVQALNGVDLSVQRGRTVAILGPSGSGKSTLLNVVGGLDKPTEGKAWVDGVDLNKISGSELDEYRLHKIGFVFQFFNLISTFTSVENVEFPMGLAGVEKSERREKAMSLLKEVGLEGRADHLPDELSGGEQQRVAIARALANDPPIILGDEPTGDLDSKSARKFMQLLKSIRKERKMTMLLVTHDPIVVAECDVAYAMRDGQIVKTLSSKDIENARTSAAHDEAMLESVI
ncbi:MAG TPA: ABC transporter ATP-binding protein [Nitrososphaerales archaeon]|nr:ABC transporter ATP-binding protein [Nitrososphaerales archaeon]